MARFCATNVNPDLAKERKTRTFDSEILTRILDGGEWLTNQRREVGKFSWDYNRPVLLEWPARKDVKRD